MEHLHKCLPLRAQEAMQKRQKNCMTQQGCKTLNEQCLPDTIVLTHVWAHRDCGSMDRACTGPSEMRSQCWVDRSPILNPEAISNCQLNEKLVFSKEASLGIHLTGILPIYYGFWFCVFMVCVCVSLLCFCLLCFFFSLYYMVFY